MQQPPFFPIHPAECDIDVNVLTYSAVVNDDNDEENDERNEVAAVSQSLPSILEAGAEETAEGNTAEDSGNSSRPRRRR